jgi:CHAT domain-containing protein/lipopolysaccharide biosynthesis regulator YciM
MIPYAHRSFFSFWIVIYFSLVFAGFSQTAGEFNEEDYKNRLIQACKSKNDSLIEALIRSHRLRVKPCVEGLIHESIVQQLSGKTALSDQSRNCADRIANGFEEIFGEKSLSIAAAFLDSCSDKMLHVKLLADSLNTRGTKLRGKKETRDEALQCYQRALEYYRDIGDRSGEGNVLGGIGFIYWYKGDRDKTLTSFQEALTIREAVDDRQLVGNSYSDIGSVHFVFFKDYHKAIDHFLKSVEIRQSIGDLESLSRTLPRLAIAYERLGNLDEAFSNYQRAAELGRILGNQSRTGISLYNAGLMLKNSGEYIKALDLLSEALAIHRELNDQKRVGETLNVMGNIYRRLGEYEAALRTHQENVGIMKTLGNEQGVATGIMNLGILYKNLERKEKAVEQYESALELFKKLEHEEGILNSLTNLGSTHQELGNLEMSETCLREALEKSQAMNYKDAVTSNMNNLANTLNFSGRLDEALTLLEEALPMAEELNKPELTVAVLLSIGDNYERRGEYDTAMSYYHQALKVVESQRVSLLSEQYKAGYFSRQRYIFESIVHLLGKMDRIDPSADYAARAFHIAEQGKARAFLDLLAESLAGVRQGSDENLIGRQTALLAEMAKIQKELQNESMKPERNFEILENLKGQLSELERRQKDLEIEIREKNPRYSELQYPRPVTIEEVQKSVLDGKTVMLAYFLGDSSSSLWAVSNKRFSHFILPERKILEDQIEILRYALEHPEEENPDFFAGSSHRLYELLIQPAEKSIPKNKRLIIIPDGILHLLPFEILTTGEIEANTSYGKLPYLIRRNAVCYCQSASVLAKLMEERRTKKAKSERTLFAMGDPVFETGSDSSAGPAESHLTGSTPFQRLEHSGEEIKNIASLFPEKQTTLLLRDQATEENLKHSGALQNADYIHLATHGIVNERKPDFSGLLFPQTTESEEDGFLQAAEIFNLPLRADLAVLSACETGLGKMVRGEGIIGLTRAFMYAGAPSVVMSLWRVSDISTAELMQRFYANIMKKNMDKAEALRRSKISMIQSKEFCHPFYWSAFILTGKWK